MHGHFQIAQLCTVVVTLSSSSGACCSPLCVSKVQTGGSMGSNNGWSLAGAAPQPLGATSGVPLPRPPSAAEREMEDRMANINSAWGSRI